MIYSLKHQQEKVSFWRGINIEEKEKKKKRKTLMGLQ